MWVGRAQLAAAVSNAGGLACFNEDLRGLGLKDGVFCYLRKPVDPERLMRRVRTAVHSGTRMTRVHELLSTPVR